MPSLSQFWGVKKGNNSSTSRQGLFPFSRKLSSASTRGRQHLRTQSDNTVVCYNGSRGTRKTDVSKRTSPNVVRRGDDCRESYESRYERYRQIYLATSPERELSTLNAAIVNVRKWLKKKHESLQSLQRSHDTAVRSTDNKLQADNTDLTTQHSDQALLEKLVSEAGHQQEAVDVLLDRGRRYLHHRACITLEVDLDNLAFLWNSYTKQLFLLHDHLDASLSHPDILSPGEGKENLHLHSTPVRSKRAIRGTPERQFLPTTPEKHQLPAFSIEGNESFDSVPRCENPSLSFAESDQYKVAQQLTPDRSTPENSTPDRSTPDHSTPDRSILENSTPDHSTPDNSNTTFAAQKAAASLGSQPSNADLTRATFSEGKLEGSEEKTDRETSAEEASKARQESSLTPAKTRRALPPTPREGSTVSEREEGRGKRSPSSPQSPRAKLLAATPWPGESTTNGWLKVAGEGIFTPSPRQQRRAELLSHGAPSPPSPSSPSGRDQSQALTPPAGESLAAAGACPPRVRRAGVGQTTTTTAAEGLLGKRSKEIRNEQQQKQQQQSREKTQQAKQQVEQSDADGATKDEAAPAAIQQLQLGLSESEENLRMEIEEALKEISGSVMEMEEEAETTTAADSLTDLISLLDDNTSTNNNKDSSTPTDTKASDNDLFTLDDLDLPTGPKRRRMNADTPSSLSSCSGSGSPLMSGDNSQSGTPTSSPAGSLRRDFKQRYKKDELWKAIESNYKYLMDKEIIETCQSTDCDVTEEEEDVVPSVSFAEFLKQYQELIDWLNQAQRNTQRTVNSLSEKYLNQTYHEEMLEKSPRREFLNKYAHQLLLRYPSLRDQVHLRMQRLHSQWQVVEAAITPNAGDSNTDSMMQDLECDLSALRRWLNATESRLLPLTIRADWTDTELEDRLRQHQALQQDIESHSRIVSAVLKLSERLEHLRASCTSSSECESLQLVALNLERRWHGIWLQSLEWQCRLEEAINRRKGLYGSGFNFSSFTLPTLDESYGSDLDLKVNGSITASSNGSLIELSDDSLLFIGARTEHQVADTLSLSGPESPTESLTRPSFSRPSLPSPKLTNFLDRSSGDSANISESESKMGDSPRGVSLSEGHADLSLSLSSDGELDSRGHLTKALHEPKDIGYSSESQSNDETESMQQQIALECRYAGIIEVASDSPLGEKMAIPPPGAVRSDYYCMTHVDLDSTDRTTTDDGNTTDDKENHGKETQEEKRAVDSAVRETRVKIETDFGKIETDFGKIETDFGNSSEGVSKPGLETSCGVMRNASMRGSNEDIPVKSWLESSDEAEGGMEGGKLVITEENPSSLLPGSWSESDSATESHEKIRYLIDHAEELVKTNPRPTVPGSPKRKMSPSKQTQTIVIETSSVESSCDASSENSEDSGTEEFSTATDDADETLFDSVINLNSTVDSLTSREDMSTFVASPLTMDSARLRKQTGPRGSKKDRPWSVVGFQDLRKIDFQPLSTSESAIDRMRPQTDTDSSSSTQFASPSHASTFPRRTRAKGYQRANSTYEQTSPRAAKRKLKYSSSSSATDSQNSKSSATRVAQSTEEDDERTFVYDSVEQLRGHGRPACLVESESETTDEYLTASMDEVMTSADEDPHNSTGSFSENAWDNYQMMYPTASEDATEEMLHWEPVDDMEFDDDFILTFPKGSSLLSEAISKRANKLKLKAAPGGGACEDSDSDMEDFHSVLEDAETCLKVVGHSLKKKRSNPMGTGLASPGKYAEMLATCETYISCVKNVCQHLTQEDIGINDMHRVQDVLCQWEKLHALASDRHQQAHQLKVVEDAITTMKGAVLAAQQCLSFELFTSKEELEATITTLRAKQEQLDKQKQVLGEHQQVLDAFLQHHPSVNVTKYVEELRALDKSTADTQEKVTIHLLDLENNWAVWCEYLEGQQELDMLMATDRDRLYALLCRREAGQRVTKKDVLKELETLQSNLSLYESKLSVLQAMRQRLTRVSDDQMQQSFLASLADLRNQLHVVSQRCHQMYRDTEDEEDTVLGDLSDFGRLAMSAASVHESYRAKRSIAQLSDYDAEAAVEDSSPYLQVRRGRAWSWLRSVPVQIVALMMVAGLIYVLDPDILSELASFSLTISPELRHVNGPPPL